jgi:hypothetical protein
MKKEKKSSGKIPIGVIIIMIIYFLATLLYFAMAMVAFFKKDILSNLPGFTSVSAAIPGVNIYMGVLLIVLALFSLIIAIGLLRLQNWARIFLLIFCLFNIVGDLISILGKDYVSIINLLFNLAIFLYLILSKKVRIAFNSQGFNLFKKHKKGNELERL